MKGTLEYVCHVGVSNMFMAHHPTLHAYMTLTVFDVKIFGDPSAYVLHNAAATTYYSALLLRA